MTNEERLEERLIDAHNRGYYDGVITKIKQLKASNPNINIYDAYDQVCDEYKLEWNNNKTKK
tara:strand:+ start:815 stop:1000 length:186 start_codon:yes stop_codon:yes gene_type:complete